MSDVNRVFLTGRAGGDPEVRDVGETTLGTLNFAVSEWAGQDKEEKTTWITLNFWGNRAKVCEYISKGMKLTICGRLSIRRVEADDGEVKYYTAVNVDDVVLPDKSQSSPARESSSRETKSAPKKSASKKAGKKKGSGDGLPF